ncbi:unnamed protein product [Spodoptera exigua]|nr:unnamed protein product [Spodoptera exigua]
MSRLCRSDTTALQKTGAKQATNKLWFSVSFRSPPDSAVQIRTRSQDRESHEPPNTTSDRKCLALLGWVVKEPDPSLRRVAFRARLKEPIDHHRRGPTGLMFSRGCEVSAMRHRDLGPEQEKERAVFSHCKVVPCAYKRVMLSVYVALQPGEAVSECARCSCVRETGELVARPGFPGRQRRHEGSLEIMEQ